MCTFLLFRICVSDPFAKNGDHKNFLNLKNIPSKFGADCNHKIFKITQYARQPILNRVVKVVSSVFDTGCRVTRVNIKI